MLVIEKIVCGPWFYDIMTAMDVLTEENADIKYMYIEREKFSSNLLYSLIGIV